MKPRINRIGGSLLAKLSLMLFFAVAGVSNLMAESKVYVSDFTINPGEEKVVAVNFDNGDEISDMQMEFTLPTGITFVEKSVNEDRIERGVHNVYVDKQPTGNKYKITVLTSTGEVIPGNGELIYLTLKATEAFTAQGKIVFDEIHLSDNKVPINRIDLKAFDVVVSPEVGHIATNENAFSIKRDGTHFIDVVLNNAIDVYGLSGRIKLPEGMTFGKNAKGRLDIKYGKRLPGDAVVDINEETGKLVVSAMSNEPFGREGVLFSFKVVASEELAQTSEIVISEIEVADKKNVVYTLDDVLTISVTNSYLADYLPAMDEADKLQVELDAAIAKIKKTCPDVKDNEAITTAEANVQEQIGALKSAIETAYNEETLGANKETVLAPVARIKAAVEKLLADAEAAQKAYEEEQAEQDKKAANEDAYQRLTDQIAGLQEKFDGAKFTVGNDCKDVAADFVETEQDIQGMIDAATDSVQTQYKAIALTAESTLLSAAEIEAAIEKLLADAAAAQKAYEDEQAKKAANEDACKRLTDQIAGLQEKFDGVKFTVENDCKDVAADFAGTEQDIQGMIDAATDSVQTQYKAIALTAESTLLSAAEIEAAVEKLLADAIAAQKEHGDDETVLAANEAAYKRLTDQIAGLQEKFDGAKFTVENDCKDVAADFAGTEQYIQGMIDAATDSVQTQYEAIALTAESTLLSAAEIEAAIESLLADAIAAQKAYAEEQAKIVAANEAAYKRLTEELAELQDMLYAAERKVDEECKDVAADYVEAELAVQDKLNALKAELNEKYKAVELTEENTLPAEEIRAEIEKILAEAAAAQKAFERVTGIDHIESLAGQHVKIYTVSGKRVTAVVKGQVNILVYPDGTVKRVYVK